MAAERGQIIELPRGWVVIGHPVNRSPGAFSRQDVDPEKIMLHWKLRVES